MDGQTDNLLDVWDVHQQYIHVEDIWSAVSRVGFEDLNGFLHH